MLVFGRCFFNNNAPGTWIFKDFGNMPSDMSNWVDTVLSVPRHINAGSCLIFKNAGIRRGEFSDPVLHRHSFAGGVIRNMN